MAPHIPGMKEKIATACGIDAGQIGIKAKTEERLGFTGREEGIKAFSVALLFKELSLIHIYIRRDAVDTFKKQKNKSEITEDDLKSLEKEIQDATDKFCKGIDNETAKKEKELMEL